MLWREGAYCICVMHYPFPKSRILDFSIPIEFADNHFTCIENGRKLSKLLENTVEKGDIDHHEQFLLFPQCFEKTCAADT